MLKRQAWPSCWAIAHLSGLSIKSALRLVRPFLFSLLVKLHKWNPPDLYNPENYAVLIISLLRKIVLDAAVIIWNCWINWPNSVPLTTISCFWALCSKKNISFNKFYLWGTKQYILANARNFSFKPWTRLFGKLIKLHNRKYETLRVMFCDCLRLLKPECLKVGGKGRTLNHTILFHLQGLCDCGYLWWCDGFRKFDGLNRSQWFGDFF